MPTPVSGIVGPPGGNIGQGTGGNVFRQSPTGEQMVSLVHAPYYEQARLNRIYSGGMTTTSISNATFTSGALANTTTPIVGVWNPSTNTKNLVILRATLAVTVTAATNTGPGTYVWASSVGNTAISTGAAPYNRFTLQSTGSQAKDMTNAALTGVTNVPAVKFGSCLGGGSMANFSFVGTAAGQVTPQVTSFEDFNGSLIVPPGGLLILVCTTTPVAHSASSSILWEECDA